MTFRISQLMKKNLEMTGEIRYDRQRENKCYKSRGAKLY